ncbi:sugar diacid utilization regulator [Streptosporangium album]|uniref:Sugar diacid utilization regulator n=1 Tax=Streptosporangium album TaxID=47479 RepID=A0A7W7RYT3_9ACTN|nr:PucR family transcriptional regulator [Streptosporangium album]MBB4940577.1 sugar diacid utilization regulator [Streptosporangium album]
MRLRDLCQVDHLGLKVLSGHDLLDRRIRGIATTDLIEPGRFLKADELVLTELTWHDGPESARRFVAALTEARVAALCSGTALKVPPADLIDACADAGLPMLALGVEVSFSALTEYVLRALIDEFGSVPSRPYGSRRRLASTLVDGGSLSKVVTTVAGELDVPCWVMSATGRVVVGSQPLPAGAGARLAHAFLSARFLPGTATQADGTVLSVFPVSKGAPHRIANWFLAYAGEQVRAGGEHEDLIVELAALVALERSRLEAAQRIERRVLDQLLELLASGDANLPGVVSRLHTLHIETEDGLLAVVLAVEGADRADEVGVAVLDELLRPLAPGVATAVGGEVVALVPLAGNTAAELTAHMLSGAATLEAGLGDARITVGVSSVTRGPAALSSVIEEARHARILAELGEGRVSAITGDDVSSHRSLIAAIPGELRHSFRTRLLGRLEEYDAAHQTDLIETLETFLEESGSWAATADRLHVHVNTLRYRLKRIEELTGRSLNALDERVDFLLAIRMR